MSIVQFHVDPEQGKAPGGIKIPRLTPMFSKPVAGVPCKFRSCYDTVLWPVEVSAAEWKTPDRLQPAIKAPDSPAALRLELQCLPDVELSEAQHGFAALLPERRELAHPCSVRAAVVELHADLDSRSNAGFEGQAGAVAAVGVEARRLRRRRRNAAVSAAFFCRIPAAAGVLHVSGEVLLPRSGGLEPIWATGFKERAEIVFLIGPYDQNQRKQMLELGITAKTFRLGCAPIVNLFQQTAEPILLDQRKYEYPIVPDVRRPNATEIFSVDEVVSIDPQNRETMVLRAVLFLPARNDSRQEADLLARASPAVGQAQRRRNGDDASRWSICRRGRCCPIRTR